MFIHILKRNNNSTKHFGLWWWIAIAEINVFGTKQIFEMATVLREHLNYPLHNWWKGARCFKNNTVLCAES